MRRAGRGERRREREKTGTDSIFGEKEKTGTDSIFGEKSRPWEELEEEREEREEERGGERRERERERRERERVGREKWDRHEKICQSLFSLSSSRERSELSTLFLGS